MIADAGVRRRPGAAGVIRTLLAAVLLPAALGAQGAAGAPGAQSPEEFARIYAATLNGGDYAGASRMMHPDALSTLRRFIDAVTSQDPSGEAREQVMGVRTADAAKGLTDEQVFARFIERTLGTQAGLAEAMKRARTEILGSVAEGATDRHVVYRVHLSIDGTTISKLDVMTIRRHAGGWRSMLSGDLEGMIGRVGN